MGGVLGEWRGYARGLMLLLLGICVLLISATTAGLGLLFGSIGLIMRDAITIANVVYYLLLITCGINFPVSRLPAAIQVISYGLPLTRGVEAARQAVEFERPQR